MMSTSLPVRYFWLILLSFFASCAAWGFNKNEWPITDFKNSAIDLHEIMSGGPPKDGIPSIDSPRFVNAAAAAQWLVGTEPVISVAIRGQVKAYPLQILIWHEIVNDEIGGTAVCVTFCPLCNASIVFDSTINEVRYQFGTTGRLRKSDMVMYDRQTESWWQQFTGEGIVGAMAGVRLTQLPSQIISFNEFRAQYPDGKILSRETGHDRDYGRNPYRGYDDIQSSPFLFQGEIDDRLPPMERVLSVRNADHTMLFALSELALNPVINTKIGVLPLVVFAFGRANSALDSEQIAESRLIPSAAAFEAKVGDRQLSFVLRGGVAVDEQTGTSWNVMGIATAGPLAGQRLAQLDSGVHFAFAWLAFDPEARIHRVK